MRAASKRHSHLKQSWLRVLRAGAGSLVVAATVIVAPTANASTPPPSIAERVQHAREALLPDGAGTDQDKAAVDRLAWWGNRFGVVVRPAWPNWPNWHNWPNWGNGGWPNY